jgi:hypothetical protein
MPKDLESTEPPPSPVTAHCRPGPYHPTDEEKAAKKREFEELLRLCPPLPEEMIMEDYAGRLPYRCPGGLRDGEWETWFDLKGMYLNVSMKHATLADDCYWGDEMEVLGN